MAMELEESDSDDLISWDVLRPRIVSLVQSDRVAVIHTHLISTQPKTRVQQMKRLYDAMKIHFPEYTTIRNCAPIFAIGKSRFATLLKKEDDWEPARTEHFKFPPQKETEFVAEVKTRYSSGSPFTPSTFVRWVREITGIVVTEGYVTSFLERQFGEIQKGLASPLEAKRYTVEQEYVDAYVHELFDLVQNMPCCLLFNADESGIDDFVDAKKKHVLAPASVPASQLAYSVARKANHVTLLPLINFGQGGFCPYLITRRRTTDADVYSHGLRKDVELRLEYSEKGYMTIPLFLLWAREIFFPAVAKVRAENNTGKAWAVLLLDGFRGHTGTELLAEMHANGVHVVYFPPHSTHALQPEDLTTFAGLKKLLRSYNAESDLGTQATLIHRIVHVCQDSTTMHKNIAAFERAGFEIDSSGPLPCVRINVPKLKEQIALLHADYPDAESESDSSSSS
jgi:hypothetical protein